MFTQCPQCQTIFELGIEELRAAEGQVRCGECDTVFNALATLTDVAPVGSAAAFAAMDGEHPEDGSADEGPESGQLFDMPADQDTADEDAAAHTLVSPESRLWEEKLAELGLPADADAQTGDEDDGTETLAEEAGHLGKDEPAAAETPEIAEWMRSSRTSGRRWPWIAGSAIAGLVLLAQAVHYWRADLMKSEMLSGPLTSLYSALGQPVQREWDVSGYHVAKGAVSDNPEVAGTLLVNAQLGNRSAHPQPYPLLKVTLLDRWGEAIGERFFAPAEYLADTSAQGRLLGPGENVQAAVLIVDPGQGAVSYGIDVCLREQGSRLRCAHDDGA